MYRKLFKHVLIGILFVVLLTHSGCLAEKPIQPRASAGVIDLQGYPLGDSLMRLDGEWLFFPDSTVDQLQHSKAKMINVPGSWNRLSDNNILSSGHGHGVYQLTVKVEESLELGLKIPRIFTAYDLYINDDKYVSVGTTAVDYSDGQPAYLLQTVYFTAQPGENELLFQVSNFHHRSGGLLESIDIGAADLIYKTQIGNIAFDLFIFGSLFMIAVYHLALFLFRRKYKAPFYFGLFCLLIALRTLLVGERFFFYMFGDFSWELAHKMQTVTYYLGMPVILLFCYYFFSGWFGKKTILTICGISLPFILVVLITPARIFTVFNPAYQFFSAITIIYIISVLTRILLKEKDKKDLPIIIIGAFIMILTSINDILYFSVWLNDHPSDTLRLFIRTGNLSSIGQLVFVLTFALIMARRISDSFTNEEKMTAQLKDINRTLDEKVAMRTQALEEASEKVAQQKSELEEANKKLQTLSLRDPLTNLWNRRQYDMVFSQEWDRALRHQTMISLLVIDIDFFKAYNDRFGHAQGDECLVHLANYLKGCFERAGELSARYGGEEFVVILPGLEPNQAYNEAVRLCHGIEKLAISHPDSQVSEYVTVSVGVASTIPPSAMNVDRLFEVADQAMYEAKKKGRNQAELIVI